MISTLLLTLAANWLLCFGSTSHLKHLCSMLNPFTLARNTALTTGVCFLLSIDPIPTVANEFSLTSKSRVLESYISKSIDDKTSLAITVAPKEKSTAQLNNLKPTNSPNSKLAASLMLPEALEYSKTVNKKEEVQLHRKKSEKELTELLSLAAKTKSSVRKTQSQQNLVEKKILQLSTKRTDYWNVKQSLLTESNELIQIVNQVGYSNVEYLFDMSFSDSKTKPFKNFRSVSKIKKMKFIGKLVSHKQFHLIF
jgi:hypothetical protein